jgi:dethiobiotin synthetase
MGSRYPPTLFILGTDRNIGKTVTSIGIISKLSSPEHGYKMEDIGYIKPVGQETVSVLNGAGVTIQADKDAVLLTSLMGIECCGYEKMSPVVWRDGLTATYIDKASTGNPLEGREAFLQSIRDAYRHVAEGKRIVIVEGTGQPGVGSVAGISNGDVINTLREMGVEVFVILVARGGIGSTIDAIFPHVMALDHLGTKVNGLIINNVLTDKIGKVRRYLENYYGQVFPRLYGPRLEVQSAPAILGFVPSVPELELPTMRFIATHMVDDRDHIEVIAPEDFDVSACRLVYNLKVISLDFGYESLLEPGDAVIVGVNANDVILAILLLHERMVRKHGRGLSGLILSCKDVGGLAPRIQDLIMQGDLPTISLHHDSAEIVQAIENMTVKIQPYDEQKRELIARAYCEHLKLWPELQASAGSHDN